MDGLDWTGLDCVVLVYCDHSVVLRVLYPYSVTRLGYAVSLYLRRITQSISHTTKANTRVTRRLDCNSIPGVFLWPGSSAY